MTQNSRTVPEIIAALDSLFCELKYGVDWNSAQAADLVPAVKQLQMIGEYAGAVHAQIELRALTNNELVPGVAIKDIVVHRKWHDQEAAEQLAQEQFGDAAFERKLKSPAGIEKLGKDGKTFVAVASYKPEAPKKVVY